MLPELGAALPDLAAVLRWDRPRALHEEEFKQRVAQAHLRGECSNVVAQRYHEHFKFPSCIVDDDGSDGEVVCVCQTCATTCQAAKKAERTVSGNAFCSCPCVGRVVPPYFDGSASDRTSALCLVQCKLYSQALPSKELESAFRTTTGDAEVYYKAGTTRDRCAAALAKHSSRGMLRIMIMLPHFTENAADDAGVPHTSTTIQPSSTDTRRDVILIIDKSNLHKFFPPAFVAALRHYTPI